MSNFVSFIFGTCSGIYIAQNYDIPDIKIATDKRGFEYLKDYREIDIIKITSSPLIKKNIIKFLYSIIIILFSIIKSIYLLLIKRPSIVIGMGGYSSFPICIAASILKIKFIYTV